MPGLLRTLKYQLEYAGFRAVTGFISVLPLETASWLIGWFWRCLAPLTSRHKRAMAAIAEAFPERDNAWHKARISEMWDNLGRVVAEAVHLEQIVAEGRVVLENPQEVQAWLGGKPQFVASAPHLGNWEVGVAVCPVLDVEICGIYQRLHNPIIERHIRSLRLPLYERGLFPKQTDAARNVMRTLRSGGSLATMGDLRDWSGPSVPFFGKPAPSNVFPALMARTFNLPLFAVSVARVPAEGKNVRFLVRFVAIEVPRTKDRDADVQHATAALQAQFELFIRAYPGQWMWAHRRWG